MALKIAHRTQEGIDILDLTGRLTLGEEDLLLRNEIDKAITAGNIRLVLNLGEVTQIDTTGLSTLSYAQAELRQAGGGLALANLRLIHMKLLVVAKMEAEFEVFREVQDAINSFFPDRTIQRYDILEFVESMRQKQT